jgi:hypothetical protein
MPMNAPERSDGLRQADHIQGHRGTPGAHTTPHELCPNEQAPPRGPVGPDIPIRGTSETFAGGAGI